MMTVLIRWLYRRLRLNRTINLWKKFALQKDQPLVLSELRLAHPAAFSPASEVALAAALSDLSLPFPLSDFQTFSVHALLNQQALLCVVPTGQRCIFLKAAVQVKIHFAMTSPQKVN